MLPFRIFHLLRLLKKYDSNLRSLDEIIVNYFKNNRALGSKDRRFIRDYIYDIIRNRGLIDYLLDRKRIEKSWHNRYLELSSPTFNLERKNLLYPEFLRLGLSEDLYDILYKGYGLDGVMRFYEVNRTEAPLTIRTNPLKTTRNFLVNRWKNTYHCTCCKKVPLGIKFKNRYQLTHLSEFKKGFFEIQDESSQQTVATIPFLKVNNVLDYCAGAGGKSLAIAPNVDRIFLFDIRKKSLKEAEKRLKRAGIKNYTIFFSKSSMKKLEQSMDVVIIDVPCSGTGTFRRHPEKLWEFSKKELEKLILLQRRIVKSALIFLKPNGRLVYITCSILFEENENQISFFEENFGLKLENKPLKIWPLPGQGDGFFSASLKFRY